MKATIIYPISLFRRKRMFYDFRITRKDLKNIMLAKIGEHYGSKHVSLDENKDIEFEMDSNGRVMSIRATAEEVLPIEDDD